MQIHELDNFIGTPSESDYLALDDGTETFKIPMTDVGITTEMTQAEAETGTETAPRVISPAVLNSFVASELTPIKERPYVTEEGSSGNWTWHKWSDGTVEAWYSEYINQTVAFTTHSGSNYYYTNADWVSKGVNIPSGIFTNTDTAFVNIGCNGYINAFISARTATAVIVRAFTPYSASPTINYLQLYVKGRWE